MKARYCAIISGIIFLAAHSYADTISMNDGRELKGVVLERGAEKIHFWAETGEVIIDKADISDITEDSEEDNIILMADAARAKGDYVKAFYLYQKVFKMNVNSQAAIDGMAITQNYLVKNKESNAIVTYYQRYGGYDGTPMADGEVLSQNAEQTEEVRKKLGLILAVEDTKFFFVKIKVTDVISGSRADKAGIQISDYIAEVAGRPADYMGLYSVISLMYNNRDNPIEVVIERFVRLWVDNLGSPQPGGLSLNKESRGFNVSGIKPGSAADQIGLKQGDEIVMVQGVPARKMNSDDPLGLVGADGPRYIDIIVRRVVTV